MTREVDEKYYNLIIELIKSHRKFPGYEAILEDIAQDVCEHAKTILQTVTNEDVITSYLTRVVSTSIITVPKKMNFNNNVKHRVISPTLDFVAKPKEEVVSAEELESLLVEDEKAVISNETQDDILTELVTEPSVSTYEPADKNLVDMMINGISTDKSQKDEDLEQVNELDVVEELVDEEPVEELKTEELVTEELDVVEELVDEEPVEELETEELVTDELDVVEEQVDEEPVEELETEELVTEELDVVEEQVDEEPVEELETEELVTDELDVVEELVDEETVEELETEELVTDELDVVEELVDEEPVEELETEELVTDELDVVEELVDEEPVEELETEELVTDELDVVEELVAEEAAELLTEEVEAEEQPLEGFDDIVNNEEFKAPSYDVFNYEPNYDVYNDEKEINETLIDLQRKNPNLDIINVCKMKFEQKLSVNKIAENLNIDVSKVIEALNEIVDELKD